WQWRWYAPGLLIAATALAGCGPGHGLSLGRVQGKVTSKGEPVKFGTVFFVADTSKGTDGPSAMATIKEDGTYILAAGRAGDGALVGHHKVGVVGLDPTPATGAAEKPAPSPEEAPQDVLKGRAKGAQQARRRPTPANATGDTFTDRGGRTYRYVIPK